MVRKRDIVQRQRQERSELEKTQDIRRTQEAQVRAQRFRKGFRGLWDRVIGNHKKITRQNQTEIQHSLQRDRAELEKVVFRQLEDRRALHQHIKQVRQATVAEASRQYDLPPAEIEDWVYQAKAGMENALRAKPEDVREQYERQVKQLQEAYGEAMLELRARKKLESLLGKDES